MLATTMPMVLVGMVVVVVVVAVDKKKKKKEHKRRCAWRDLAESGTSGH